MIKKKVRGIHLHHLDNERCLLLISQDILNIFNDLTHVDVEIGGENLYNDWGFTAKDQGYVVREYLDINKEKLKDYRSRVLLIDKENRDTLIKELKLLIQIVKGIKND